MFITIADYADFKTLVQTVGGQKGVFFNSSTGNFVAYAFVDNGSVLLSTGNLITEPSTFAMDFPSAKQITDAIDPVAAASSVSDNGTLISLNAATTTGPGSALMLSAPTNRVGMQVVFTGSPTNVEVAFQGTIDGSTWFTIDDPGNIAGSNGIIFGSGQGLISGGPAPVVGIRANLIALSGGTNPTVTATVSAAN